MALAGPGLVSSKLRIFSKSYLNRIFSSSKFQNWASDFPIIRVFARKEGEAIYSISRGILNKKMIDLAEEAGVNFVFNSKVC